MGYESWAVVPPVVVDVLSSGMFRMGVSTQFSYVRVT